MANNFTTMTNMSRFSAIIPSLMSYFRCPACHNTCKLDLNVAGARIYHDKEHDPYMQLFAIRWFAKLSFQSKVPHW